MLVLPDQLRERYEFATHAWKSNGSYRVIAMPTPKSLEDEEERREQDEYERMIELHELQR